MTAKLICIALLIIAGLVMFAWAEADYNLSKRVTNIEVKKELEDLSFYRYATSATCFFTALFALIFVMVEGANGG